MTVYSWLAIIPLVLLSMIVKAEATYSVGTIQYSVHYKASEKYNEVHEGLYFKVNRIMFGQYVNTYSNRSNFIAYEAPLKVGNNLSFSLITGLADGYLEDGGLMPLFGIRTKYYFTQIIVTPVFIVFGLEFSL